MILLHDVAALVRVSTLYDVHIRMKSPTDTFLTQYIPNVKQHMTVFHNKLN
jgi:methylglyoxal synthase